MRQMMKVLRVNEINALLARELLEWIYIYKYVLFAHLSNFYEMSEDLGALLQLFLTSNPVANGHREAIEAIYHRLDVGGPIALLPLTIQQFSLL